MSRDGGGGDDAVDSAVDKARILRDRNSDHSSWDEAFFVPTSSSDE